MARLLPSRTRISDWTVIAAVCFATAVPAAAQNASLDPSRISVDRKVAGGLVVTQVKPDYPALAKVNYIQGKVRVQVLVNADGRVGEAHVMHGHPFLAASALKAIHRWVYRPFVTRSGPVAFETLVDMNFSLRPHKLEQLPMQPESDLTRQVHPPEIIDQPSESGSIKSVRLRVLVSDKGQVIDSLPIHGLPTLYNAARKTIENWKFRPAKWGSLAVPWYLEVDVPVENVTLRQSQGEPGG